MYIFSALHLPPATGKGLACVLLIFFGYLPYQASGQNWKKGQNESAFLVKPYLQFSTQTSMYVLWETKKSGTTVVEYGEALLAAESPNLDKTVRLPQTRTLHEVKLEGLKPETKYLYRVRSKIQGGLEVISPVYTFRTAVRDSSAYFFAFIGDSQKNNKTPWAWGKIAELVWKDRPNFIVHAGDIVDTGTKKSDWTEDFFPDGHIAMSRFPMYTVLGNHEQDAQYYYDYMVNPDPEYYYTFHYGNAQFFMIDTNRDVTEGSEQYNWLEWELAKSDATWKFVMHHHPPYSSEENDHGDTYIGASSFETHARNLVPLYEAYGVDFCLFGHTHVYERTWPVFKNKVNLKEGVVYINSGGAGGGLEDFDPTRSWFTQELQTGHHYCTFAIFDRTMVFKAIDHEGSMFDAFQMDKPLNENGRAQIVQPPAPHINTPKSLFENQTTVKLEAFSPAYKLYYTLDGAEPSQSSTAYSGPITIAKSCTLTTRAFSPEGKASRMVSKTFRKMEPLPAQKVKKPEAGLRYAYYEGEPWNKLPDFSDLNPVREGVLKKVNESEFSPRADYWGVVMKGFVKVPEDGSYTFFTRSDDGSKLYVDGQLIVDHDGLHGATFGMGEVILKAGYHKIRIESFERDGGQMIRAGYLDNSGDKNPFSPMQLAH